MEQRASIITLGVRDLKTSRAFYDSLGWKIAAEHFAENILFYNMNGFVLAFYPLDALANEIGETIPAQGTTFTLAYNVKSKVDVDQTLQSVEHCGGKIECPAKDRHWGGYSGYFTDPDHYYWEVAFNPYSLPNPDGTYQIND